MSILSKGLKKLGSNIKHVVVTNARGLGRLEEKLAPIAGAIPGVGPLLGAAIGAHGSILAGHNAQHTLGAAAKGGIGGLAGGAIGGVLKGGMSAAGGGLQGILSGAKSAGGSLLSVLGGGLKGTPGIAGGSGPTMADPTGVFQLPDGGGGIGGTLQGLLGALSGGKGIPGLLGVGAGVSGYLDAKKQQGRSDDLLKQQMALAAAQQARGQELFDGAKPIRTAAESGLAAELARGRPQAPSLAGLRDAANPFSGQFSSGLASRLAPPTAPTPTPAAPAPAAPAPAPMPAAPPSLVGALRPPARRTPTSWVGRAAALQGGAR